MEITILGAESLGVRSMACLVKTSDRLVLIDPGVALAPRRFGFAPHQLELKRAAEVRNRIINILPGVTDIVISHFHGDHAPLKQPDPVQLSLTAFTTALRTARIYVKSRQANTRLMNTRHLDFAAELGRHLIIADCRVEPGLEFSFPVLHGQTGRGTVLMTKITDSETVFVHASDIQLLDEQAVNIIINWQPDILFAAGPPIYLPQLSPAALNWAFTNALRLCRVVKTLILDHHLLRSLNGIDWLNRLRETCPGRIISAAEWQGQQPELLEARRRQIYSRTLD
ncbi:MAG: MBL fold metallo-hydrolase [candidate division WOR-3 bacterium]